MKYLSITLLAGLLMFQWPVPEDDAKSGFPPAPFFSKK